MKANPKERDFLQRFSERYQKVFSKTALDIEEESLGTRCGASSWSTPDQVERMAAATGLEPGDVFLDIGSGAGWPGLRIATLTGATPVLSDVTLEGLSLTTQADRTVVSVQSDASLLPFVDAAFTAVTHSDVVCCLPRKEETIRECRRVLARGRKMVFTVIAAAPGISDLDLAELEYTGNEFVFSDRPYSELLASAGFEAEITDVTTAFRDLAEHLHRVRSNRYPQLVELWGETEAQEMLMRARANRDAAARRTLVRYYVDATAV